MERAKKKKKKKKGKASTFPDLRLFPNLRSRSTLVYALTRITPPAILHLFLSLPRIVAPKPVRITLRNKHVFIFLISPNIAYRLRIFDIRPISGRYEPIWSKLDNAEEWVARGENPYLDIFQFILFRSKDILKIEISSNFLPLSSLKLRIIVIFYRIGWI